MEEPMLEDVFHVFATRGNGCGKGCWVGAFWQDIKSKLVKCGHGQEAFCLPRVDDRWKPH